MTKVKKSPKLLMLKPFSLGLIVLFLLLAAGIYLFREAIFWKTYENEEISFKYPASWSVNNVPLQYVSDMGDYSLSISGNLAHFYLYRAEDLLTPEESLRAYKDSVKKVIINKSSWLYAYIPGDQEADYKWLYLYSSEKDNRLYEISFFEPKKNNFFDDLKMEFIFKTFLNSILLK